MAGLADRCEDEDCPSNLPYVVKARTEAHAALDRRRAKLMDAINYRLLQEYITASEMPIFNPGAGCGKCYRPCRR
jgi:hypothetical protein